MNIMTPQTDADRKERRSPIITVWPDYDPQSIFEALCHMTQASKYRSLYDCTFAQPAESTFIELKRPRTTPGCIRP